MAVLYAVVKKRAETIKYAVNSVAATNADFLTFHALHKGLGGEAVMSTLGGNAVGAGVSFLILQQWVFRDAAPTRMRRKVSRFALGVAVSMAANMALMAAMHHGIGMSAWPARVGSAVGAWGVGYWFNKKVVFKKTENETSI